MTRPFGLFARFVEWWFGELAALVPRPLRRLFDRGARILVVELAGEKVVLRVFRGDRGREIGRIDLTGDDQAAQPSAFRAVAKRVNLSNTEIALRLSADQALRRTLVLPWAAEPELRQALFFQIDRQTPFAPDEVYFDYRVSARDSEAKRLTVEMTVAARSVVDDAVATATRWGLPPAIVDVAGDDLDAPPGLNLLWEANGSTDAKAWSPLNAALGVVAGVLLAAAVYVPLEQRRSAAEAMLAKVAEAKSDAEQATRLGVEIERLRDDGRFLTEEKRKVLPVINVLDEITTIIPDHTWFFELKINGKEVSIAGYSSTASALIGLIAGSPRFQTPRFRSSVTQDPRSGLERFHLSFDADPGATDR